MEEEILGTRKTSSRRSKPDLAALVDQQRFLYTYKPRCPDLTSSKLYPTVNLCSLPVFQADDSKTSEDDSPHDASPIAFSLHRKRARRSDAGSRRAKKLAVHLHNGDQLRLSSPNRLHDDVDSHCLSSQGTVQVVEDSDSLATTDTDSDEDDNLPLSSFVVPKPLLAKTDDISPSPLLHSVPSTSPNRSTPPLSPPPPPPSIKSMNLTSLSPVLCFCSKPAVIDDPRWDGEFCSPECLISLCHQAFYATFQPTAMRDKSAIV